MKHHVVQEKYLIQWKKSDKENQLHIYSIPENKCKERGPNWKGFWRVDFNILDEGEKPYLPEDITSIIDTKGIKSIRKIDLVNQKQLSAMDRSCISFYIALQYIRTPRYREEVNKLIEAYTKHFMGKDLSHPEKVGMSKENILNHQPKNKYEEEALNQIKDMTQEEINMQLFDIIKNKKYGVQITNAGHSKGILKVDRLAKKIFEMQWLFLVSPKDNFFITSDNPCFTISDSKIMNGLLSPRSIIIFPLRPDTCIYISPKLKSKTELYMDLNNNDVKSINELVLNNSYQCVISKDKTQLQDLTKNFNYEKHRKSRDVKVSESGPYTMFNIE
jgi:hypothetical protein